MKIGGDEKLVRKVVREDIMSALKKMKAAGMYGIVVGMLKSGSITIIDWLLRIFNKSMEPGVVLKD